MAPVTFATTLTLAPSSSATGIIGTCRLCHPRTNEREPHSDLTKPAREYFDIVKGVMGPGGIDEIAPRSDNNLINGKMDFDCSTVTDGTPCKSRPDLFLFYKSLSRASGTNNAGLSKFHFRHGKTHRLRLINSGAEGLQKFSIDDHEMTVIANDFVPVVPYETKFVTLGVRLPA